MTRSGPSVKRGVRRGFPGAWNSLIANKANCGGNKKAGLAPTIGVPMNILTTSIYRARPPFCCLTNNICYFRPGTKILNPGGNFIWGGLLNRPVQSTRAPYASNP